MQGFTMIGTVRKYATIKGSSSSLEKGPTAMNLSRESLSFFGPLLLVQLVLSAAKAVRKRHSVCEYEASLPFIELAPPCR